MQKNNHTTNHARHERGHCCTIIGLFKMLKSEERKETKLDVSHEVGPKNDRATLRFISFEPLGPDDLRFFQGFIAISGTDGLLLTPNPVSVIGQKLRLLLETKDDAETKNALIAHTSFYRVLHEVGLTNNGRTLKKLKESLIRLSNVGMIEYRGTAVGSSHLMSFSYDEADGKLHIALNPRVASSILGGAGYTLIDMEEVRVIKSDCIRLIHQHLCCIINLGDSQKIKLKTMYAYVWGQAPERNQTSRKRLSRIRDALSELRAIGWGVQEYVKGSFLITRPKLNPNRILEMQEYKKHQEILKNRDNTK